MFAHSAHEDSVVQRVMSLNVLGDKAAADLFAFRFRNKTICMAKLLVIPHTMSVYKTW